MPGFYWHFSCLNTCELLIFPQIVLGDIDWCLLRLSDSFLRGEVKDIFIISIITLEGFWNTYPAFISFDCSGWCSQALMGNGGVVTAAIRVIHWNVAVVWSTHISFIVMVPIGLGALFPLPMFWMPLVLILLMIIFLSIWLKSCQTEAPRTEAANCCRYLLQCSRLQEAEKLKLRPLDKGDWKLNKIHHLCRIFTCWAVEFGELSCTRSRFAM